MKILRAPYEFPTLELSTSCLDPFRSTHFTSGNQVYGIPLGQVEMAQSTWQRFILCSISSLLACMETLFLDFGND